MKYLEDSRLTQLTTDLTGAILNTRGSGLSSSAAPPPQSSLGLGGRGGGGNAGRGRGGGGSNGNGMNKGGRGSSHKKHNNKQQQQLQISGENTKKASSSSTKVNKKNNSTINSSSSSSSTNTPPNYYAYNPVGYSTYNNNGTTSSTPSSCRVIYGRVEAYTTKRAGSDKKTAFEVGERYAHEMERLNEAVEALKRRHALEHGMQKEEEEEQEEEEGGGTPDNSKEKSEGNNNNKKERRRARSRSLDGVTFDSSSTSPRRLVYDKSTTTSTMMMIDREEEGSSSFSANNNPPLSPLDEHVQASNKELKRNLPLTSILKEPSSNKRCRATSFDVSTGPSSSSSPIINRRSYHHSSESSSSLLAGNTWGISSNTALTSAVGHPIIHPDEEDVNTHPLIPQPNLYQSTLLGHHPEHQKQEGGPTMVPRRLMTDLILTLNASFPDYDFGDAQTSDFVTLSTTEAIRRINDKLSEFAATTDAGQNYLPRMWNAMDEILFCGLKDCEVYSYSPSSSTGGDDPLEFLTCSMTNENNKGGGSGNGGNGGGVTSDVRSGGVNGGSGGQNHQAPMFMFSPSGGGRIISKDVREASSPNQVPSPVTESPPPHVTLWSMNYFFVSKNKKRIVLVASVETMRTPQGDAEGQDGSDGYYDDEYGMENNVVFDEARRDEARRDNDVVIQMQQEEMVMAEEKDKVVAELAEFSSPSMAEDGESVSVMVEYTDYYDDEEHGGVDMDDDVDREASDFDTGTLSKGLEG